MCLVRMYSMYVPMYSMYACKQNTFPEMDNKIELSGTEVTLVTENSLFQSMDMNHLLLQLYMRGFPMQHNLRK